MLFWWHLWTPNWCWPSGFLLEASFHNTRKCYLEKSHQQSTRLWTLWTTITGVAWYAHGRISGMHIMLWRWPTPFWLDLRLTAWEETHPWLCRSVQEQVVRSSQAQVWIYHYSATWTLNEDTLYSSISVSLCTGCSQTSSEKFHLQ